MASPLVDCIFFFSRSASENALPSARAADSLSAGKERLSRLSLLRFDGSVDSDGVDMDWKDIVSGLTFGDGPQRLRLTVAGRVQGVGFRPSVYRFARTSGVAGFVRNTQRGVIIEVEGSARAIHSFGRMLVEEPPPLARIDSLKAVRVEPSGDEDFIIESSEEPGAAETLFPVDTAVCRDCLQEMRDPGDRRFRYPFINCTNCGPRFTIIKDLPYDRPLTTMREFEMGSFCRSQYTDPGDRRFHAEPISCPDCGPHVTLIDRDGHEVPGDPIREAQRFIREGAILAVKGLGGYHLACLATDDAVVRKLRTRKKRPAKPFALMFKSIEEIGAYCRLDSTERRLLLSPESPIVLLRSSGKKLPEIIAPKNGYLGAFLPYTPLHHLLMEVFGVLIMTSANFTDEPLISNEVELEGVLPTIADAAIVHNRRIAHKCDDSIFFVPADSIVPIRRARGFVPEPIRLFHSTDASILALGGQEKGTFALTRGGGAFISPHLGDLGDIRSQRNYRGELEDFKRLLKVEPVICAHDMHPDYFTTRLAREIDCETTYTVQHHHAHAVSVMAEYGLDEPVIAVTFDGTGYGSDGRLWGGEFLLARYGTFERLAHLKYLPLPGGEAAIREPWRMGLMHLENLFGDRVLEEDLPEPCNFTGLPHRQVLELAKHGINSPLSSSMGRLFDAVSFMLGCGGRVSYEAEAAVALEALALETGESETMYRFDFIDKAVTEIDPAPVIEGILGDLRAGTPARVIASAFHSSISDMVFDLSVKLARKYRCKSVVVSGGVFQNRLLVERLFARVQSVPVQFYQHVLVPPNDGGVSLGQAQIAATRFKEEID